MSTVTPPCRPYIPPGTVKISFEDGGLDGWVGQPRATTLQNSTAFAADGTHSLLVTLNNITSRDYPYLTVGRPFLNPPPLPGQTLSLWVYVPDNTAHLQGKLLVMDKRGWYSPAMVSLTSGQWNLLTYTIPATGPILRIGVQFNNQNIGSPIQINQGLTTDVYIDAVGWV